MIWQTALSLVAVGVVAASAMGQELAREADGPPLEFSTEAGVALASYLDDLAHSEFFSVYISRPFKYSWRVGVSHDSRFGDEGLGLSAGYTRYWNSGWHVSLGFATGTGDFIHPDYQLGLTVGHPIRSEWGLIGSVSYLRTEGKGAYSSDSFLGGLSWYVGGHWIFGGWGRYDIGHPGETESFGGGFGITYSVYKQTSVGAWFDYGDVSYMLSPGKLLVETTTMGYNLAFSQQITSSVGLSLLLGYTDYYDGGGATLKVFKEW